MVSGLQTRADAAVIKQYYQASVHPKVINGEISEDEAFLNFLSNFPDSNNDGTVDIDEWCEYWMKIAATIPDQDHFVQMMRKAWRR